MREVEGLAFCAHPLDVDDDDLGARDGHGGEQGRRAADQAGSDDDDLRLAHLFALLREARTKDAHGNEPASFAVMKYRRGARRRPLNEIRGYPQMERGLASNSLFISRLGAIVRLSHAE